MLLLDDVDRAMLACLFLLGSCFVNMVPVYSICTRILSALLYNDSDRGLNLNAKKYLFHILTVFP